MIRYLSDRIPVTPPGDVESDRYEFLHPSSAEPNLGVAPGDDYILVTDAAGVRSWKTPTDIPGVVAPVWFTVNSNYQAADKDAILADTTQGSFSIALPANPAEGDIVTLADIGNWQDANLLITRNGSTIEGMEVDFNLDISHTKITFIYDGDTWHVYI
jgi:hypothetical protein